MNEAVGMDAFTMNFNFHATKIKFKLPEGNIRMVACEGRNKNELYLETKAPICTAEEIACVVLLYINKAEEII